MIKLYITHPFGTFNIKPYLESDDMDRILDLAFDHIAAIVPECSVWIECNGVTLRLMN